MNLLCLYRDKAGFVNSFEDRAILDGVRAILGRVRAIPNGVRAFLGRVRAIPNGVRAILARVRAFPKVNRAIAPNIVQLSKNEPHHSNLVILPPPNLLRPRPDIGFIKSKN